jgi:hypothetical protein
MAGKDTDKKDIEKIVWGKNPQEAINREKQKLLRMSEISLWLDTYDDIFSDFDPRPFSQRAMSDDFLLEAKKASKEKISGTIQLNFLMPADRRNSEQENTIKKRLHEHFKRHHDILHKEKNHIIAKGIYFILAGIILMFAATFILFKYSNKSLLTNFLVILLEPGGWFFFWEGLGQIVFETKKKSPNLDFYEKMSKCEIGFLSY